VDNPILQSSIETNIADANSTQVLEIQANTGNSVEYCLLVAVLCLVLVQLVVNMS
jgi:hypothetical protein